MPDLDDPQILAEGVKPDAAIEFWDSNFPPNGFRCRCTVITLSERQVKKKGLTVQSDMPGPTMWTDPKTGMEYHVNFPGADRGFSNNPFKEWGTGKLPKDWQQGLPPGWKSYEKVRGKDGQPPLRGAKSILAALDREAAKVNPDYKKDEGCNCKRNCQRCALVYERRRRGENVEARPNPYLDRSGTTKRKNMNGSEAFKNAKVYGKNHLGGKAITKKELERSLNLLPDGARAAIFWINPDLESGHVIVCEKVGGNLIYIDPQTGSRGNNTLKACDPGIGYSWYRMDNLEFNGDFEWDEVMKNAR